MRAAITAGGGAVGVSFALYFNGHSMSTVNKGARLSQREAASQFKVALSVIGEDGDEIVAMMKAARSRDKLG